MHETDVFVVGGGPAGLALAVAARAKGLTVTVADGMSPPIDKVCGEGLMPDSLAALERIGIRVPAESSCPFRGIRFLHQGSEVDASFPAGSGLGIRRTLLHKHLADEAANRGARLLWGTPVTGINGVSVHFGRDRVRARWMVGADGGDSRVRAWSGLEGRRRESIRFGFRRHYRVPPWSDCMELHWGRDCQIYVTPITRKSGSVDAITGEGLSLAFHQASSLAGALERADLKSYEHSHRRLMRWPALMADLMLSIDRFPSLRMRALRALSANPRVFARLLAMHVGALPVSQLAVTAIALGWSLLTA